ncbi:MAG: succinyldiaminopimelate transaminase [Pseudomonadales bacterium]
MNPDLSLLQAYPFERLKQLKRGIEPKPEHNAIALSIGEPKHPPPQFVLQHLQDQLGLISNYPSTIGSIELRSTIAQWLCRRFQLTELDPVSQVLPVNGTREALFAFAQAMIDRTEGNPLVLMPNPFYQIYEGAALLAGAKPYFLQCDATTDYLPDFDSVSPETWGDCQLLYICSPGNPTGKVIKRNTLQKLIELAHRHNFIIAADECYSEIYPDETTPPEGLLQASAAMGNDDYSRCMVFHSLSKRSNLPGLRSGFVAGDKSLIEQFLRYRTYHGCAMSLPIQQASIAAWNDESHVLDNRDLYRQKFAAVTEILTPCMKIEQPDAGFYLWPQLEQSDTLLAQQLYREGNITVLPGSFLGREVNGINPGANHIRMALVATIDECTTAAHRIRQIIEASC